MSEESLFEFPCEFTIKVMGLNTDTFVHDMSLIAQQYMKDFDKDSMRITESSAAKYLSLSVTVNVDNKAQLDGVYRAFHAHSDVKMVL
ncbi:MAG: DUF493 domain-containing protein [Mariprofundaceae bacterium]